MSEWKRAGANMSDGGPMSGGGGYESWFLSARDPAGRRGLWIRHTRQRPLPGSAAAAQSPAETAALWCTIIDRDVSPAPIAVKQVLAAHPADTVAGRSLFRGQATMGGRSARWELAISARAEPLRPLRPGFLYRAPLPRTKLEASVPDGLISGTVDIDGHSVAVSDWRGTVGHNWGSEHADTWVWLHAAGFDADPGAWLELVLARIRVGGARSPWMAMGALGSGGELIPLGGLGRQPRARVQPGRLTARVTATGGTMLLTVRTGEADAVAVAYADPSGGQRSVRHAALAAVMLTLRRRNHRNLTLTGGQGAYEYGTSQTLPGIDLVALPDG
jgi:hypothetical protein